MGRHLVTPHTMFVPKTACRVLKPLQGFWVPSLPIVGATIPARNDEVLSAFCKTVCVMSAYHFVALLRRGYVR
ncbi:MAG: hypothetical protein LBD53_00410 [Tannerella sp.]|nr:hypothetical protein [Tannerella sp.]